ncbi:MAG TPA: ParB N-terminal domain-containing protein [Gammaproteobacteria bacterium]|nr:ParB N-terminal domain-containing protein [Gammaproteobacteria bacterium]
MKRNQSSSAPTRRDNIRIWTHGELTMPGWLSKQIVGDIEPNGTFTLETDMGHVRVHPGSIVIERCGTIWIRPLEEAVDFMESLEMETPPTITNIGPGKTRRFGTVGASKGKSKNRRKENTDRWLLYSPPAGSPPSIEWIKLDRLSIDSAYQRSTDNEASCRLIASIATKFDWRLCTPLAVSRRPDDTLTIIDGQHRWMAACRRSDIAHLPCCVFRYESTEEEARMFIVANRARKPINRLDDYFAALAAADEDALEIRQLVTGAGLSVARNTSSSAWRPGEVAFTSAISNAIRRFGSAIASAALTNLAVAFAGQRLTHGGAIFGALVRIMSKPTPDFDPDRLMSALQTMTVDDWGRLVTGLNGADARIAALREAIMQAYDRATAEDAA